VRDKWGEILEKRDYGLAILTIVFEEDFDIIMGLKGLIA
jgi:hypothetical protein